MTKRNIVHIEIPTADAARSADFYKALFGWQIVTDEKMNYTMWEPAQGPGGGFSPLGEGVEAGDVMIYVDSADIEADLEQAEALGGKAVRPKTEIPGIGWFGMFTDPTGNTIALYTSKDPEYNK
ncbi:MAG: VOC family protein [Chloroflexi bacterium]|nr:VOC family protein [Chloroflexota bacterium]